LKIGDEVFGIFDAHGVANEGFGNPGGFALFRRGLDMAGCGGRTGDGFDGAEICGEMGVAQARKKGFHCAESACDGEAEHAAKAAHLFAGERVIFMRLQPRIENLGDVGMGFEEVRNLERALILALDAKVQSLHAAQKEIRGHGIEAGPSDLAEVINLRNQIRIAAHDAAQRVGVATEKFCGAVKHKISAEFQWLLIDGSR